MGAWSRPGESAAILSRRFLAAAAMLGAATACAPALDWREVRPAGSQAVAAFPCKPASHARQVMLAGATVEMTMVACSVREVTYALVFADLQDPTRVGTAIDELARAMQSNLQGASPAASQVLVVPGMTPNARAALWQVAGRLPDGRAVTERAALFAYGTRVFQATMLGERLDAQVQEIFFGALRVGAKALAVRAPPCSQNGPGACA